MSSADANSGVAQLLFLWHFHQPHYAAVGSSEAAMPWVRLHATKSYFDMAWLLHRNPQVRCVANFSGVLLEQWEALIEGASDRWERLSRTPAAALTPEDRGFIVRHFFSCNWDRCVRSHPRYAALLALRGESFTPEAVARFGDADIRDLQLLFNLQWFGFGATAEHALVRSLRARNGGFTEHDIESLLALQRVVAADALRLWRTLVERGQVELSATPHAHPILPLLIDSDAARIAMPDAQLPAPPMRSPADAEHHVVTALNLAERIFGVRPAGMWPAEGSVSPAAAAVFARAGLSWVASDDEVLERSVRPDGAWGQQRCEAWQLETQEGRLGLIFRHHELSDRIGFAYATNDAEVAADDLVRGALRVAAASGLAMPLVPIILDGENAWESYEQDGRRFLEALYRKLGSSPEVRTVTPSEVFAGEATNTLIELHSGSWISASYRIWIGALAKNRAWELLIATRAVFAAASAEAGPAAMMQARHSLDRAEGSDWFWWYGDDFDSRMDEEFDALFRAHCRGVYEALHLPVPPELARPVSAPSLLLVEATVPVGVGEAVVDGRETHFFEWREAPVLDLLPKGAMNLSAPVFRGLRMMRGRASLFVRLDGDGPATTAGRQLTVRLVGQGVGRSVTVEEASCASDAAWLQCAELSIPLESDCSEVSLVVEVREAGLLLQRFPASGAANFALPLQSWFV